MSTETLPRRIGKYELRQKLGHGETGVVYRAYDDEHKRDVALKLMRSDIRNNDHAQQRFIENAHDSANINHPHLISIYDVQTDPELFLVMEFIPIGSLDDYLTDHLQAKHVTDAHDVLRLAATLADALQTVHNQEIVHQNIKPSNIMLRSLAILPQPTFHPILSDLGRIIFDKVTNSHNPTLQSLIYRSPEQLNDETLDHRTDIYSLGIILYELLLGQPPFAPKTLAQAVEMHTNHAPPLPRKIRTAIFPQLENLILRAIAYHPDNRFQSVHDMAEAIRNIQLTQSSQLRNLNTSAKQADKLTSLKQYVTGVSNEPDKLKAIPVDPSDPSPIQIILFAPNEATRYFSLIDFPIAIGRSQGNDIVLTSKHISRYHAQINQLADGFYIEDLDSRTGTYIDGVRLLTSSPKRWNYGHEVQIGEYRLILELRQEMEMGTVRHMAVDLWYAPLKPSDEPQQFTAFFPEAVVPDQHYSLMVFVHLPTVVNQVQEIATGFAPLMGGKHQASETVDSALSIPDGTPITFVPRIPGLQIYPERVTVNWHPPLQSANFLISIPKNVNVAMSGYILVMNGLVLLGEIPIWMKTSGSPRGKDDVTHASMSRYNKVFACYSHKDTPVIEYFREVRHNLGQKLLVDIYDLRAGDHWQKQLLEFIDQSDVFQLFWSEFSAASPYCRNEWTHALQYDNVRPRFIQPIWWQSPLVTPPEELAHIHFQKVHFNAVEDAIKATKNLAIKQSTSDQYLGD